MFRNSKAVIAVARAAGRIHPSCGVEPGRVRVEVRSIRKRVLASRWIRGSGRRRCPFGHGLAPDVAIETQPRYC
jgi:hypothetical protein